MSGSKLCCANNRSLQGFVFSISCIARQASCCKLIVQFVNGDILQVEGAAANGVGVCQIQVFVQVYRTCIDIEVTIVFVQGAVDGQGTFAGFGNIGVVHGFGGAIADQAADGICVAGYSRCAKGQRGSGSNIERGITAGFQYHEAAAGRTERSTGAGRFKVI